MVLFNRPAGRALGSAGKKPRQAEEPLRALRPKVTLAFGATFVLFCADRAVQLGILAILARTLSPAQFGVAAGATMFVSIASQLFQFGMGPTLIQAATLDGRVLATARTLIFVLALACFAMMQACAPLVGAWFRSADVTAGVRVLSVICLVNAVSLIPHSSLIRNLRARDVSLIDLACGVLGNGLVAVPLAILGFGFWALIAGVIVQVIAKAIVLEVLTGLRWRLGFGWAEARQLWIRGTGFSLTLFLHRVALESDRLIVGRFLNTAALGLYSRANGLMALPSTLYGAVVDRVIFPAFSQIQNDPLRMRRGYSHALSLTALLGGSLSVFLVFQGPNVIRFVLGPAWEGAVTPFNILCAAIYFRLSDRVSGTLLRGCGKPYLMAGVQTLSAGVTIGGCLLAHPYGISGIAVAVVAGSVTSYLFMSAATMSVVRLGLRDFLLSQAQGVAVSLLIAAVLCPIGRLAILWGWPPFVCLAIAGLAAAGAAVVAAFLAPRVFLGSPGRQLLHVVLAKVSVWRQDR